MLSSQVTLGKVMSKCDRHTKLLLAIIDKVTKERRAKRKALVAKVAAKLHSR